MYSTNYNPIQNLFFLGQSLTSRLKTWVGTGSDIPVQRIKVQRPPPMFGQLRFAVENTVCVSSAEMNTFWYWYLVRITGHCLVTVNIKQWSLLLHSNLKCCIVLIQGDWRTDGLAEICFMFYCACIQIFALNNFNVFCKCCIVIIQRDDRRADV